jgi:hypothetical protein
VLADTPLPSTRIVVRATVVVVGLVTAQFFTLHRDGTMTPAGILSITTDEWRSPGWDRIRRACAVVEDFTTFG